MEDTRSEARSLIERLEFSSTVALIKSGLCLLAAAIAFWLPQDPSLSDAARWTLFILTFAAGLWAAEAIPAFAVALLVIGLQIGILGRPGGVFSQEPNDWEQFAATLGNPLIWLFFGGFVLAAAADKTGLNRALACEVLRRAGNRPGAILASSMAITFVFSMFISNTAAATMMIAVMLPLIATLAPEDRFRKAMMLGIAFAANLGGMGTVIGSPPNAIAAGALRGVEPIDFFGWVLAAAPPALVMVTLTWAYLMLRYSAATQRIDLVTFVAGGPASDLAVWRRWLVVAVFTVTVILWLSQSLHGIPATVISFVPICVFCAAGVINGDDICAIRWDVLLLIAGGLSLGLAVTQTGLAGWLVGLLPLDRVANLAVVMLLGFATMSLSNVMSNTAAANILVPIAIVVGVGAEAATVVPVALSASAAMCLPISTPPNAIAYGTGQLQTRDLIEGGLWIGILAPLLATLWCSQVL
jgi:solute carrier family 13 (sodium-dependent dicarboxylate transporter), member 2/3/5